LCCALIKELEIGDEKYHKLTRSQIVKGKVIVPKSKENGNAMATIADPDGNMIGLHQSAKK